MASQWKPANASEIVQLIGNAANDYRRADQRVGHEVALEPVYGCRYQCNQCWFKEIPEERQFMSPRRLRALLPHFRDALETVRADADRFALTGNNYEFTFSERGNPLDHPKLHELTAAIRSHFPKECIGAFWNMGGVHTYAAFKRRTQGLDRLGLSLDDHHYAGLAKELRNLRKYKGKPLTREIIFGEMRKRIGWALRAAKENDFSIVVRLVGKESLILPSRERERYEQLLHEAQAQHKADGAIPYMPERKKRAPPGSGYSAGYRISDGPIALNVLHDGTVSIGVPKPKANKPQTARGRRAA